MLGNHINRNQARCSRMTTDHQSREPMSVEHPHLNDPNVQKVYEEASNWLRMVNVITWSMAAIFIPLSLACFPLAMKNLGYEPVFAFASLMLYGIWIYIGLLYSRSADVTREALFHVEEVWNLPTELRFYSRQGKLAKKRYGLHNVECFSFIVLVLAWVCFLSIVRVPGTN